MKTRLKDFFEFQKPVNYKADKEEFAIFDNLDKLYYPNPNVGFLKNVRVSTSSVVFKYFKIFKKSCIGNNHQKYSKGYKFYLKYIFPKFTFKKKFILITDEWTNNYYHWHIFALTRLLILKKRNLVKDAYLILPKKYSNYKFVLSSLEKFGIKKDKIIFLPKKSNIKVANLHVAHISQYNLLIKEIRKILLDNTADKNILNCDKIYISRQGQVLRYIENEEEVLKMLEKYGFKKVIMENISYEDQINICKNAKYLIGPHGAGLTNITFMQEGSSLLELATKPDSYKPVTDYYRQALLLGINYFYQECQAGGKIRDFHHGSLIVDLKELEENLRLMLGLER